MSEKQEAACGFHDVLFDLKSGNAKRAYRKGWNGKGIFIFFQSGYVAIIESAGSDILGMEEGAETVYCDTLAIKTAQNTLGPWRPTQPDMFADDWVIEY